MKKELISVHYKVSHQLSKKAWDHIWQPKIRLRVSNEIKNQVMMELKGSFSMQIRHMQESIESQVRSEITWLSLVS